jgi:prolyl 4-hydroxylase
MPAASLSENAFALVDSGRAREAVTKLQGLADQGDAEALFILATWFLSGDILRRDLPRSRDLFRRAAEAGHEEAPAVYRAFVANGTGGTAEWKRAVDLLEGAAGVDPQAARQLALIRAMALTRKGDPERVPPAQPLSSAPDVRLFPTLLSPAECDFVVSCAEPMMQPSLVVDPRTGGQIPNPIRTSDGASFPLVLENPAIHALNRRLAAASGTVVSQGEPLQVLRYRPGQQYRAHSDAISGADNQRVLTFLVWLNDDYEGGETAFLETGLEVKGRKGDGLLFRNAAPDGRADPLARHAGLPVTRGSKLLASRWIRARPIDLNRPLR